MGNNLTTLVFNTAQASLSMEYNGYTFTSLDYLHYENTDGITEIVASAFEGNTELVTVHLPKTITTINTNAFNSCTRLTTVSAQSGNGLLTIGNNAFQFCSALSTFPFTGFPVLTTIGENAFGACSSLTSLTVANTITSIGTGAFANCLSLLNVTFSPSSLLTTMQEAVFSQCYALTSVSGFPANITTISTQSFVGCSVLATFTFDTTPSLLTTIDEYAFANTTLLPFPFNQTPNLIIIGQNAFSGSGVTNATIPITVTSIGTYAFGYCGNLTSVTFTLPSNITTIPESCFYDCSALTSISIPNSVTTIDENAFFNCSSIVTAVLSTSLTTIGNNAFQNNTLLTTIMFPTTITTIGDYAFSGSGIDNFFAGTPSLLTTIGDYAFLQCPNLSTAIIPPSVTTLGTGIFQQCSNLANVTIDNSIITEIPDYMFNACSALTTITIPPSIVAIGDYAFQNNASLTTITFTPTSSLVAIGAVAFQGCFALASFPFNELPNIATIGNVAFATCTRLTSITIPNTVTAIGEASFSSCSALTDVTFDSPSAMNVIDREAFSRNQNLTTVTSFPNGLHTISERMFQSCSALFTITFEPLSLLEIIDAHAFSATRSLTNFPFNQTPNLKIIGKNAFANSGFVTITVPDTIEEIATASFRTNSLIWFENSSPTLTLGLNAFATDFNSSSHTLFTSSASNPIYNYINTYYPETKIIIGPSCYHESTKILTDKGYVTIHKMKVGTKVKTLNDGYKKVTKIHFQPFTANNKSYKTSIYKLKLKNWFKQIILTGSHAILLNKPPKHMETMIKEHANEDWLIDGKHISLAGINPEFEKMETGTYNVYHFVLENDDKKRRYAVYANGILSESMSEGFYEEVRGKCFA